MLVEENFVLVYSQSTRIIIFNPFVKEDYYV